jgi:hypothetical protein
MAGVLQTLRTLSFERPYTQSSGCLSGSEEFASPVGPDDGCRCTLLDPPKRLQSTENLAHPPRERELHNRQSEEPLGPNWTRSTFVVNPHFSKPVFCLESPGIPSQGAGKPCNDVACFAKAHSYALQFRTLRLATDVRLFGIARETGTAAVRLRRCNATSGQTSPILPYRRAILNWFSSCRGAR